MFWVYGSDPQRFEESYLDIARRLSLPGWNDQHVDILQLVHDELINDNCGRWLFILDNADDASIYQGGKGGDRASGTGKPKSYARYLPQSAQGYILVTTRDKRVGERLSGRHKPIEITPMTAVECKELLRSKIVEEDWCETDAMKLAAELGHLPLAITQAAAFISENNLSISEYLDTLHADDEDAKALLSEHLDDPRRDLDTENSVIRMWKLSFDQMSRNIPRAAEILSLMSVLDYQSVPLELLRRDKELEASFRTALGALQAFSLISATRGRDGIGKMHQLVAMSTQKWLELNGTLGHWRSEALTVMTESFPEWAKQTPTEWVRYETLVPHVSAVLSFPFTTTNDQLQCAKLLAVVTLYYLSKGRYGNALDMSSRSLEIRQNLLAHDDPLVLDSVQTYGEALLHQGELQLARTMLEKAVEGREKVLGPGNPDTLESLSDLTITLLELDDLATAETTAMRALSGRRQLFGEHHPNTLTSLNILAILRHRQGQLAEAKTTYETVLAQREAVLSPEHPDTLMALNNFARLLYDQGDLKAAKQVFKRVSDGEGRILSAEGYDIQVTLTNMALVLIAEDELTEAEETLRKILEMRERLLGVEHPSTMFTVGMLAELQKQRGDHKAGDNIDTAVVGREEGQVQEASALLRAGLLFD